MPSSISAWVQCRADGIDAAVGLDRAQLRNVPDIDQLVGTSQTQIEHRPDRLAAGKNLGFSIADGEPLRRFVQRPRAGIVQRCGFHAASFSGALGLALAIALRMRSGVAGMSRSTAFNGDNASLMALTIAADGAIAPPSPTPLMPCAE